MIIAGLEKLTLVDFPAHVAATIFLRGCPFRCKFCHNPELVIPAQYAEPISKDIVLEYLSSRRGKLDGVCISGGEPTIWDDLESFIEEIYARGYHIKLDTNGFFPDRVKKILASGKIYMVAMDVKAPLERYSDIVGIAADWQVIQESINIIMQACVEGLIQDYLFRTTVASPLIQEKDMQGIGRLIKGARCYVLQNFVLSKHVGDVVALHSCTPEELNRYADYVRNDVDRVIIHY